MFGETQAGLGVKGLTGGSAVRWGRGVKAKLGALDSLRRNLH